MTDFKPDLNSGAQSELDRLKALLKAAVPPIPQDAELSRDLWPGLLRRIDREPARVPWFDWALGALLIALAAAFPTVIPVFLYYL